ncbi:MAG: hypothetical protein IJR87_06995 [Bacteroidaceae bacterium]|nr:hypothetical protein [Bacteroidaceae bacterium]
MEKYELQKLRDLPIEGVAERLGLRVRAHKALCPFHDDHHPSLSFSTRRNTFRCVVCGASGGPVDLVMGCLKKGFLEACRWLADEHNVILTEHKPTEGEWAPKPFDASRYARCFEHPWLIDEARRFLFDERRIDERVVRWCRLSSFKERNGMSWLSIPYFSRDGRLIGVQNRNLLKGAQPRFRFPPGCDTSLYGLPVLNRLRQGGMLFIAEGVTDCLALMSSGCPAVAIPSATLLKPRDAELLREMASQLQLTIGMYPDNDAPGMALYNQLKEILPDLIRYELPAGCKDFGDYYRSANDLNNSG